MTLTSTRTVGGAMALMCSTTRRSISRWSWSGTSRVEIFAAAQAGMIVFEPSPE
jgi:hypothetical protein